MAASADFEVVDLVRQGGIIMYPLIVCSVLSTAIIAERLFALAGAARRGRDLTGRVLGRVRGGDFRGAAATAMESRSALAPVLLAGLDRAGTAEPPAPAVERARARSNQELRRGLWILGTIGAAAPFVGLFGTVVGIIRCFHEIGRTGQGGFATVSAGIAEALIATGAGIAVAVVAFCTHNFFQVKVGAIAAEWKLLAEELVEALARATRAPAPVPVPLPAPVPDPVPATDDASGPEVRVS